MRKGNIILGVLICLVLVMAIAFAAFSSSLNITGTSTIDSKWDIKITNVEVTTTVGKATKAMEPIYSGTSATFKTNLVSPGDSMTYTVTITNNGTVDAKVGSIDKSTPTNSAILFTTSGINENDLLEAGATTTYKVTIAYSDSVTSQPSQLTDSLTVKLNYVQNA